MPRVFSSVETSQPQVSELLRLALTRNQLAHAYLLQASRLNEAYSMALDVARALNCEQPPAKDAYCGTCRNCQWLARNAHPSFITLSRMTYPVDGDEKRKSARSQIGTEQVSRLIGQLQISQPGVRVVVFTDVETAAPATPEQAEGEEGFGSGWLPPYEWRAANPGKGLALVPLTERIFTAKSVNQFLKTLEEPPGRVVFFFLSNSEANLLDTVVSRCQVLRFAGQPRQLALPQALALGLEAWWQAVRRKESILLLSEQLELLLASIPDFSLAQLIEAMQRWFQAQATVLEPKVYWQIQRTLQQSLDQARSHVTPAAVLLDLQARLQQLGPAAR